MGLEATPSKDEMWSTACTFPDLHRAVITNNPKLLLSYASCTEDINQRDENSFAPLHLAVSLRKLELVKFLLKECRADVNVRTQSGLTPLHVAAFGPEKFDILRTLIQNGSKVNSTDDNGCTALHLAVRSQASKSVMVLLEEGCDHAALDKKGRTAKDIAIEYKSLELIDILNEHEEQLSPRSDTQVNIIPPLFARTKHDLIRRSCSLVSSASTLKTIMENENFADTYYSEREFQDAESVGIDSESDRSSPDFPDNPSLESVFSYQNPSLDSLYNNNRPDFFRKRFENVSNTSLNSFNSSDSVYKLASTFHTRLLNGIQSNGYGRPLTGSRKTPVHRTRSLEVSQLPSVRNRLLSSSADAFIGSRKTDPLEVVNEGLPTPIGSDNISNTNQKYVNSILQSEQFLDRSDNLYCLDVNENIQAPRLRKMASSSFSVGDINKQSDAECDEDILALLHPEDDYHIGNSILVQSSTI